MKEADYAFTEARSLNEKMEDLRAAQNHYARVSVPINIFVMFHVVKTFVCLLMWWRPQESCTLLVLIFADFAVFDKVRENMLFWKILSFVGNFWHFCSNSMANPRKYIPAKYGQFCHCENKYPRKLIPIS